jgi:TonB family protein
VVGTARSNALEVSRPKDIPNEEPEPTGGTLASNRSSHQGANGRRAPVTPKPERARTGNSRQARGALPAAADAGAVAKASAPQMSSAARAPGPDRPEAGHVAAKLPAANSVAPNSPPTNILQTRDTQASLQSSSPAGSSVEKAKANTADTAQLSKPDEPIAAANNNGTKSAVVPVPEPARVPPPKTNVADAQPAVTYNPPRPLKQVLPKVAALPPGAADAAGEVRVVVRVDETGRVVDARVMEGRNKVWWLLASAALTAAKQWTFEPASLRGKNIASDHTIVFQFRH